MSAKVERILSKVKHHGKYFFQVEANPIKSDIQRFICANLDELGMTQRRFAQEFTEYSTATYGTWRRQEVAMGLDVLEKILFKYPNLKEQLSDYLRGNTEKKLTDDGKTTISRDEELLQVYRDHYIQSKALISELNEKITDLQKRLGEGKKDKARPAHN